MPLNRRLIQLYPVNFPDKDLVKELERIDRDIDDFCSDPMAEYYRIADDFIPEFKKKGKAIFNELCKRGVMNCDGDVLTLSC